MKEIRDKIRAAIYGYAIGDALGKGTEFMTVSEAAHRYPEGLHDYNQIIRDAHRSQWKKNEWTLDTDNVVRAIKCILDAGGIDFQAQAQSIKEWYETQPTDSTPLVRRVAAERDFLVHPHAAARRIWNQLNESASNEALGAAMFAALNPTDPAKTASEFSGITHADPRCLGSAAVIGLFANKLLWEGKIPERDEVEKVAAEYDTRILRYLQMAYESPLDTYALDDEDSLWFTRKSMAAALWPLVQHKTGDQALFDVIAEGGDADTNASLALALVGLRDGFKAIPKHLANDIAHRDILEDLSNKYADYLIGKAGIKEK